MIIYVYSLCISASHLVSISHFQSIFLSHSLALSSALHNLSCNAAPGALLNLLLLAVRPGNINKPGGTMEQLNEHHTRIVAHHKGTGRRPPHFLCHRRESSIIILLHFYALRFHPHLLLSFPHFPSLLTYSNPYHHHPWRRKKKGRVIVMNGSALVFDLKSLTLFG